MEIRSVTKDGKDYPKQLLNISGPPQKLYFMGRSLVQLLKRPSVAIVGTRRVSTCGEELLEQNQLSVSEFNQVLTMLEINGKIRPLGAKNWALA